MKALLLSRYKHLEIADLPEPAPGATCMATTGRRGGGFRQL